MNFLPNRLTHAFDVFFRFVEGEEIGCRLRRDDTLAHPEDILAAARLGEPDRSARP